MRIEKLSAYNDKKQNVNKVKNNVAFGDFYINTSKKALVDIFDMINDAPKSRIEEMVDEFWGILKFRKRTEKGSVIKTVISTDEIGNLTATIGAEPWAKMKHSTQKLSELKDVTAKGHIFSREGSIDFWNKINYAQEDVKKIAELD